MRDAGFEQYLQSMRPIRHHRKPGVAFSFEHRIPYQLKSAGR